MKKIWTLILLPVMFACREKPAATSVRRAAIVPADTIIVSQRNQGYKLPATFEGLSFETNMLTSDTGFLNVRNKLLVQLIKNLGGGILRIGGATSDKVYWSENRRSLKTTAGPLTKTDIDRLSAFSKAIGWQVIFGLNLASSNTEAASNEALYVKRSLGDNLYAFQSGNEPDLYKSGLRPANYNYANYQEEWGAYLSAVRLKVPGAPFAGPDVSFNFHWVRSFVQNENDKIKLIDRHYYPLGPATDKSITYHTLLARNSNPVDYLQAIKTEAAKYHLPYRITECNNIFGGGKKGVSDVFASALWALDFMWTAAENNSEGINFHGGYGLPYSPITVKNGVLGACPEYYAMLAFKYATTGGTVIPASVFYKNRESCNAYACTRGDSTYCFTLINKDDKNSYSFRVLLYKAATTMQIARLKAPSITATTGITFAGSRVNADGSFKIKTTKHYAVYGKSIVVKVPAGSAAVVTVQ